MARHAGYTTPLPKGSVEHRILEKAALQQFECYARQRPQLRFADLEITVQEDRLHHLERGMWDVQSELVWS